MEKRQRIYKYIMLVLIVAIITFLLTSVYMYKILESKGQYIYVTANDNEIGNTLASFRKLIDQKYLGKINEEDLVNGAIKGYIAGLNDPYTEYFTKEEMSDFTTDVFGNFVGIGIYMGNNIEDNRIMIISPIKGTPAYKAGLQAGDIITKVDGVEYKGEDLSIASNKIKGEIGTKVKIEILRDDKTLEFEIVRDTIKINHVESEVLEKNIGYIVFNTFDEGCATEFEEQYKELKKKNIKGLIVDVRNNGGGLVQEALNIAKLIVPKDTTLLITVNKTGAEEIEKNDKEPIIDVPIILLTNEGTASASEILAGALKDNEKAKIVGTKTYGKGVIQELITLQDGSGIKITTQEYYTPNRNKINNVGIEPDVNIELPGEVDTALTLQQKDDTQLQNAIELLKSGI